MWFTFGTLQFQSVWVYSYLTRGLRGEARALASNVWLFCHINVRDGARPHALAPAFSRHAFLGPVREALDH